MRKNITKSPPPSDAQFNMTAMIDVVFLLIIFFMLVCQFIVQENYRLFIPDDCKAAEVSDHLDHNAVTVSVFQRPIPASSDAHSRNIDSPCDVLYAVRSQQYDPMDPIYRNDREKLFADMAASIAQQAMRKSDALVHLRADHDVAYRDVQHVLLALGRAGITRVQLAAFQSRQYTQHDIGSTDVSHGTE